MDLRKLVIIFFSLLFLVSLILAILLSKSQSHLQNVPAGCYYQQVQCIQAPCDPILVCPELSTYQESTPTPTLTASCKTGGCSGELCLDTNSPDVASICIYRAGFACYQSAKCEVQPTGGCGWTETPELVSCLQNPPTLQ